LTSAAPIAPSKKGIKKTTRPNANPIRAKLKLIAELGNRVNDKPMKAITKIE
jgi:hypothetical protein